MNRAIAMRNRIRNRGRTRGWRLSDEFARVPRRLPTLHRPPRCRFCGRMPAAIQRECPPGTSGWLDGRARRRICWDCALRIGLIVWPSANDRLAVHAAIRREQAPNILAAAMFYAPNDWRREAIGARLAEVLATGATVGRRTPLTPEGVKGVEGG